VRENEKEKREKQREKKSKKRKNQKKREREKREGKHQEKFKKISAPPLPLFFCSASFLLSLSSFFVEAKEREKRGSGTKTSLFLLIKCWRT